MPSSLKHLLLITQDHADDEIEMFRGEFGGLKKVILLVAGLGYALVLFMVVGYMQLAKVDTSKAAKDTQEVLHAAGSAVGGRGEEGSPDSPAEPAEVPAAGNP